MDWARAIERNREALVPIVAALFAMLGLGAGATLERIPRDLRRAVLRVLRPAESAVRRLIVIAARDLVVEVPPSRPMPAGRIIGGESPRLAFQLFDRRKRFELRSRRFGARVVPRIRGFASDPLVAAVWPVPKASAEAAPPPDDDPVDAGRLAGRLHALKSALDDLPCQAKRLARWQARRKQAPNPKFISPLRPGSPPGSRRKPVHEIDAVLTECHGLAFDAMQPDTS